MSVVSGHTDATPASVLRGQYASLLLLLLLPASLTLVSSVVGGWAGEGAARRSVSAMLLLME